MSNIRKYVYYVARALKRMRYFPWRIPLLDILNKTLSIIHIYNPWFLKKLDNSIIEFLESNFEEIIDKYINSTNPSSDSDGKGTIWTCWWQGEENAPVLVQRCIESIRHNAGYHPMVVITWENLSQYVNLPEHIIALVRNGKLTLTFLSDVLRAKLLAVHGGLWLDSTMFYVTPLEETLWDEPFFSPRALIKHGVNYDSREMFWSLCLQMAKKGHPLYLCLSDFYDYFFSLYKIEPHYLLAAYIGEIVIKRLGIYNNPAILKKKKHPYVVMLDATMDCLTFEQFPPTHFFQITYKKNWSEYNSGGKYTVYGILMNERSLFND